MPHLPRAQHSGLSSGGQPTGAVWRTAQSADGVLPPAAFVSLERTAEILEDLYDPYVSEGTIVEACHTVAQWVQPVCQTIKAELQETEAPGRFNEPGGWVEKALW